MSRDESTSQASFSLFVAGLAVSGLSINLM